ncbi:MAG TPA: ATP-binding cassette domain-containing protein [Thermoanaerobaculaceae bacterium]|nr:ATP-binding cassette domain-containing protein [Thermoanaerobaculaceae bacterium]
MSDAGAPVVEVRELAKSFGAHTVLESVSMELRRGETVVVLGGSGEGKSVFLKHINGLLRPDHGTVTVLGFAVSGADEDDLVGLRRRVSYIFQHGALFDSLTVGENVAFPMRENTALDDDEIAGRVASLLERVGLSGTESLAPAELSGGMRKRVALARGLALEPEVILYDEPTAGLDPVTGLAITALIGEVTRATAATSLVVTHDIAVAAKLAERIAFLSRGRFVFTGTVAEAAREEGEVGRFVRAGGFHA